MEYSEFELRAIARDIVSKSKEAAHVDTGRLKRSISYVVDLKGIITFTEVFYGQFGDNSDLEENIKKMMPSGVPWKLIYVDDNGNPFQLVRKLVSGRSAVETKVTKATTRKSLGIAGIKNFLKGFTNGEKKNESTNTDRQDSEEKS